MYLPASGVGGYIGPYDVLQAVEGSSRLGPVLASLEALPRGGGGDQGVGGLLQGQGAQAARTGLESRACVQHGGEVLSHLLATPGAPQPRGCWGRTALKCSLMDCTVSNKRLTLVLEK